MRTEPCVTWVVAPEGLLAPAAGVGLRGLGIGVGGPLRGVCVLPPVRPGVRAAFRRSGERDAGVDHAAVARQPEAGTA